MQTSDPSYGAIILGLRMQTSDPRICCANLRSVDLLRKPQIHTQSSRIAQPNPGYPWQQTTIDCASEAARPSTETKPQPIARTKQFDLLRQRSHERLHSKAAHPSAATKHNRSRSRAHTTALQATMANHRGFVATDGRAALRAILIVGLLPRMAEIWLRNPR